MELPLHARLDFCRFGTNLKKGKSVGHGLQLPVHHLSVTYVSGS